MAKPMATSQDFANWVCSAEIDPDFLMYALICARSYLRDIATGATHKTIYMPTLKSFHICLPEVDEQKRIAKLARLGLKEIEEAKKAAEQQLQEISILSQRLLQTAFGGR
jgi:type I restriction enzyme S subunit